MSINEPIRDPRAQPLYSSSLGQDLRPLSKRAIKGREAVKETAIATVFAAATMLAASVTTFALDDDSHYKDLYELKLLHTAFHKAVSHAGIDAATKARHLADILALWTDDGTLIAKGMTYIGKGSPGTASCAPGSRTLCDWYANVAGSFVLGHDWVTLTPIYTEAITVLDSDNADIYFQCIYFDVNDHDARVAQISFGLQGMPDTGRARKVNGRWLLSYAKLGF